MITKSCFSLIHIHSGPTVLCSKATIHTLPSSRTQTREIAFSEILHVLRKTEHRRNLQFLKKNFFLEVAIITSVSILLTKAKSQSKRQCSQLIMDNSPTRGKWPKNLVCFSYLQLYDCVSVQFLSHQQYFNDM
jgi:hypothetical protein